MSRAERYIYDPGDDEPAAIVEMVRRMKGGGVVVRQVSSGAQESPPRGAEFRLTAAFFDRYYRRLP